MGTVILSGIVTGVLYGLAGLALVVVYRASRVVNFGAGGIGALSSYIALSSLRSNVPYGLAYVIALAAGALIGVLAEFLIARPLARRPHLVVGIATLGLLLALQGVVIWHWGVNTNALPEVVSSSKGFHLDGVLVSESDIYILGMAGVSFVLLTILTRYTRFGLSMRATSAGPVTASVLGINLGRVRQISWAIGGLLAALAALLVAPISYLDPNSFNNFMFLTFIAVVMGGFTSLGGVFVGGIVFGVVVDLIETYLTTRLTHTFIFVFVVIVLLVKPYGLFGRQEREIAEPPLPVIPSAAMRQLRQYTSRLTNFVAARTAPGRGVVKSARTLTTVIQVRRGSSYGGVALLVIMILLTIYGPLNVRALLPAAIATYVAVLGLNLLGGYCGQLSVGHGFFLGVGAYTGAIIDKDWHLPALATLPFSFVVAGVAGLIIGLPATRLRSYLYLALLMLVLTFAFPELVNRFGYFTGGTDGLPYALPASLGDPGRQTWLFGVIAAVMTALAGVAIRSRIGRAWRAVRESEAGAMSSGINPTTAKLSAFALSAAFAGVGGAMSAMAVGYISPDYYDVWLSIYLVVAIIVGGLASIPGSLIGALFITVVPLYTQNTPLPSDVVYGVVLIVVLVVASDGISGLLTQVAIRVEGLVGRRRPASLAVGLESDGPASAAAVVENRVVERVPSEVSSLECVNADAQTPKDHQPDHGSLVLEVRGVCAGYGGVPVLDDIDLIVGRGEIVAILGANGAGKSTALRAISGLILKSRGSVKVLGYDVTRWPAHRIARLGIAQVLEGRGIFPDLSVAENLELGRHGIGHARPGVTWDSTGPLDLFPALKTRLKIPAGDLSGGQQQMVAIARALCSRPELLMLDEPSLGLSPLLAGQVLESLTAARALGVSVLLVEQNVRQALRITDRGYVLVHGRVTLAGNAHDLEDNDELLSAYLGMHAAVHT